jgi:hypothetical protein
MSTKFRRYDEKCQIKIKPKCVVCRSAALFHTKHYEDCIKDINRAIDSGYPKPEMLYRLYLRKAQCLKFLKMDFEGCLTDAMKVPLGIIYI